MGSVNSIAADGNKDEAPLGWRVLPDFVAFGIGLCAAYLLKWETKDLVWSLWLGSLVLGYTTFLSVLCGGAYLEFHAIMQKDSNKKYCLPALFGGIGIGAFFLAFFSFHFCGFHAGHSVFLKYFFPIEGLPEDGFGAAFMNPPLLWMLTFRHLVKPYGAFLIPALIAERRHVFQQLFKAILAVREGRKADGMVEESRKAGKNNRDRDFLGEAMGRPYINVIRMHLLIFFFAFCHALKIESFVVYTVVYFVYFFPWREMKRLKKSNHALDATR